jgi:hypothetical protein
MAGQPDGRWRQPSAGSAFLKPNDTESVGQVCAKLKISAFGGVDRRKPTTCSSGNVDDLVETADDPVISVDIPPATVRR